MLYFARWKTVLIWLVVLAGVIMAAPNLVSQDRLNAMPDWLPKRQMTLGLDLQGGVHLLLEVDRADIEEERLRTAESDVRQLLREAGVGYTGLSASDGRVQFRVRDEAEIETARSALEELTQPVSTSMFAGGSITELEASEPEPGRLVYTLTEAGIDHRVSTAVSQSVEVVRRRIDELGTTEPVIQRQGTNRVLVQVPGEADPQRVKDLIGQTARLAFRMVDTSMPAQEAANGRPPANSEVLYSVEEPRVPYLVERQELVSGENLTDAQAGFDQRTNEPIVTFRFDTRGAQRFGAATQRNVGVPFAIVLDNEVISAPVIREPILGGTGQISGSFTAETANDLAILLRAGALPADLTVIEERAIGPGLGADSISAGQTASLIGAVLVVAFMIVAYGQLGVIANLALIANVTLIIAVLTLLGATLTLPGIAGIVLTMGMAVDSNVLIFERVKEEQRQGRSLIQSLDAGFSRAMATVIDANMTTLIAAVILFYLGSGPVRGFAITLAIGIITTVFTAFTLTRWLIAAWLRRMKPKQIPNGLATLVPANTSVPFMKARKLAYVFSIVTTIASIGLFFSMGMNYGIDFRGGSSIEIQALDGEADVADVRDRLNALQIGDVQVQEFGSASDLLVRIGASEDDEGAQEAISQAQAALQQDYDIRRVEVVGPTVSSELATAGTIGVLAALVAMLIYIWLRFEWHFGLGAIVTTAHDVALMVGFFVISGIEFNLTSIAAILTVVGYSINDTVVIYDRVRENLRRYKKMPIIELLDLSMNQTLSRTILTGVTTLLALTSLYIFGGEVIASFTLAMIMGILIGTYSSVFVAGPLLDLFKLRPGTFAEDDEKSDAEVASQTHPSRQGTV
ncbi:protein translocase subunit SecDF [Pararhizobium haloflavum]|uniref:protein translocase subunit SecDF n=1 Tax=Pararhizobium haloflavum TaxID=2037914 RepID=UPI000C17558E|nr:protein translocase subunit SecDF [Pararhizobium haloflavum]